MHDQNQTIQIEDGNLYDTNAAGAFLGFRPSTLRNSRISGKLAGVDGPAYLKMGSSVRYRGETLRAWRDQFSEQTSTSEAA